MAQYKYDCKFRSIYEHVYGFCEVAQTICDDDPTIGGGERLVDLLHRSIGIFVCRIYSDRFFGSLEAQIKDLPIYEAYLKIRDVELRNRVPVSDAEYPLVWLKKLFYAIEDYDSNCW